MWREARKTMDPVAAWESISQDPKKAARYKSVRGQGGFVRADWNTATEMIAAANAFTVKKFGPDRVVGFSPIPAMSMVSYAAGARYLSLSAAPACRSTTGTATCHRPARRSGANRPTCPNRPTGTTPPT
jgi:nitrate reductase alpha subunit